MKNKLLENFINLDKLCLKNEYSGVNVFDAYVKVIASGGTIDLVAQHFKKKRRAIKKKVKCYIKENFVRTKFRNTEDLDNYIRNHLKK